MQKTELLIFDSDCAFCTRCVEWGKAKLRNFPEAQGFQSLDLQNYQLTLDQAQSSIWLIRPNQKPLPANEAVAAILRGQPQYFWRLLGNLAEAYWVKPFAKALYYSIAKNRHRLPGSTPDCELPKHDR